MQINGGQQWRTNLFSGSTLTADADDHIIIYTGSTTCTLSLPKPSDFFYVTSPTGLVYTIRNAGQNAGAIMTVDVTGNSGGTQYFIDAPTPTSAATITLNQGECVSLVTMLGSKYYVLHRT